MGMLEDYKTGVAEMMKTASLGLPPTEMMDLLVFMIEGAKMHLENLESRFPDEAKAFRELYATAAKNTLG